jgi:uncharacterized protein (TIGR02246 family)
MATRNEPSTTESSTTREIGALLDQWVAAARRGDLDAIMACYTPDVRAFDAIGPLHFKDRDAYRAHWEACLSHIQGGELIMEIHHLHVIEAGDLALGSYLSLGGCTDADGNEAPMGWMRGTVACRRTADGWRIAHEHISVPFDPETMKAAEGLTP